MEDMSAQTCRRRRIFVFTVWFCLGFCLFWAWGSLFNVLARLDLTLGQERFLALWGNGLLALVLGVVLGLLRIRTRCVMAALCGAWGFAAWIFISFALRAMHYRFELPEELPHGVWDVYLWVFLLVLVRKVAPATLGMVVGFLGGRLGADLVCRARPRPTSS